MNELNLSTTVVKVRKLGDSEWHDEQLCGHQYEKMRRLARTHAAEYYAAQIHVDEDHIEIETLLDDETRVVTVDIEIEKHFDGSIQPRKAAP